MYRRQKLCDDSFCRRRGKHGGLERRLTSSLLIVLKLQSSCLGSSTSTDVTDAERREQSGPAQNEQRSQRGQASLTASALLVTGSSRRCCRQIPRLRDCLHAWVPPGARICARRSRPLGGRVVHFVSSAVVSSSTVSVAESGGVGSVELLTQDRARTTVLGVSMTTTQPWQ